MDTGQSDGCRRRLSFLRTAAVERKRRKASNEINHRHGLTKMMVERVSKSMTRCGPDV